VEDGHSCGHASGVARHSPGVKFPGVRESTPAPCLPPTAMEQTPPTSTLTPPTSAPTLPLPTPPTSPPPASPTFAVSHQHVEHMQVMHGTLNIVHHSAPTTATPATTFAELRAKDRMPVDRASVDGIVGSSVCSARVCQRVDGPGVMVRQVSASFGGPTQAMSTTAPSTSASDRDGIRTPSWILDFWHGQELQERPQVLGGE